MINMVRMESIVMHIMSLTEAPDPVDGNQHYDQQFQQKRYAVLDRAADLAVIIGGEDDLVCWVKPANKIFCSQKIASPPARIHENMTNISTTKQGQSQKSSQARVLATLFSQ